MPNNHHRPQQWLYTQAGKHILICAIQRAYQKECSQWIDPAQLHIHAIKFHQKMAGSIQFECKTSHGKQRWSADFTCHPNGHISVQNLSIQRHTLSRRNFLKGTALFSGAMALLPEANTTTIEPPIPISRYQIQIIPLPPCMMLHSQHGTDMGRDGFFPQFLQLVEEQSYTTVTFQSWLTAVLAEDNLPEKPLIISMDDMAMDMGNPAFRYFQDMHDQLAIRNMVGTFGIVTRPNLRQEDSRWELVREWAENGFEMATHTSEHTNFNQRDSSARADLTQEHINAEIINSATMIQERIQQPVTALITPYGSGFNRQTQEIHAGIIEACQQANIRMVIGITDGREPISIEALENPDSILYCGRTTPGNDNAYGSNL